MRILVLGAGVIGSVYAVALHEAGHDVVMLARGRRLAELRTHGLLVEEAESGRRTKLSVPCVRAPAAGDRYDLVLVPVRSEQVAGTLPILAAMRDGSTVLFFGNTLGHRAEVVAALGTRALFGFPAAAGMRVGPVVRYALIRQQRTMLGEVDGSRPARVREVRTVLSRAGFRTTISADIDGWLLGHAAFVVPVALAIERFGGDPTRLAADRDSLRLMVLATRRTFQALRAGGDAEIPPNLQALYLWMPPAFAVAYWRRVLAGPRGELWFAAHTRAAPAEMRLLAGELRGALVRARRTVPELDSLLSYGGAGSRPTSPTASGAH